MTPTNVLKALGGSLLELLLPRRCAGCQFARPATQRGHWCAGCRDRLPWIRSPLCPVCGLPYFDSPASSDHVCGDCLLLPPPFDGARSATLYSDIVRKHIHDVKFGSRLHWIPALVELMADCWDQWDVRGLDALVPVPLHRRRIQQRGFNQAALLSQELAARLGLPVYYGTLVRSRWTEPQTRLKREIRLKNVARAFAVDDPSTVQDLSLLLIDDVFTTGSTVAACATALKDAGASRVFVLTVARSLPGWKHDFSEKRDTDEHG